MNIFLEGLVLFLKKMEEDLVQEPLLLVYNC